MKKLLLLLAFCGFAHAETLGYIQNQNKGFIAITDLPDGCGRYPGAAYAISGNTNNTLWGCWYSDDMMIHIDWNDGVRTSYFIADFTLNVEKIRRFKERRNGKSM